MSKNDYYYELSKVTPLDKEQLASIKLKTSNETNSVKQNAQQTI